ncbi:MAG: hypothetical protein J7L34_04235 [Thermotogaceae bacterium]|nr:hypothetical protein [Thermotogaceae bacterium]
MRVDPTSFNPVLGYKLDPGEPGLAYSAPASMSILRVLTQEVSNYLAFKKEAMRQGGFIISGGIYLDLRKRGGFLAAVAGKTKVFMYIPGDKNTLESKNLQNSEQSQNQPDSKQEIERKIQELQQRITQTQDPLEREKLERELTLLEMALSSFKASLKLPQFLIGSLLDTMV